MFGLGMGEILIILVLALLLLGADKLPDAARQLGRGLRDFRKATDDLKSQFEGELYAPEKKPARPTLVEPGAAAAAAAGARKGDGAAPAAEIPVAAAGNVPGLDAALVEGGPAPEAPPGPAARST
jgi:sec-independent protein translocase protein TatB